MPETFRFAGRILIVALLIVLCFGIVLNGLLDYSFWMDEGYSAWIVRDEMRQPESLRETLRFVKDSLLNTFNYVRSDVHPPFYYLLLDVWTLVAGDSEFALRLPSALMATLSLAGIYAIGRQCFNTKTGLIALLMLGTAGMFLYYAREARMYSLYLALATLSTWAYLRWWHRPGIFRGILYGIFLTLMLYTHYTAFLIILAQTIHALFTIRQWTAKSSLWQIVIPYGLSGLCFAMWLPFFMQQFVINTGFVAPGALPGDWGTLAALWLKLSGGNTIIFLLILILSRVIFQSHRNFSVIGLLLLCGFLPVIGLFAINASGLSILQLRYLIPILPSWSLLLAYLLSEMWIPLVNNKRLSLLVTIFFTGWIVYTQLVSYPIHWQAKADWRGTVSQATEERFADEPALVYLDLRSPLVYYAYQTGLLDGISINISWREFAPQEVHEIADSLDNAGTAWGIVAMQAPESWDAIVALSENRGVVYRDAVQWSVFYQFDNESDESLSFTFGNDADNPLLAYRGEFYSRYQASTGEEICVPIQLEALQAIADSYSISLHLTRGYNELVAQVDEGLGAHVAGDIIERELCLAKPDEDDFHLRLLIYNWQTSERLYVMESGFVWGQYMMRGTIEELK